MSVKGYGYRFHLKVSILEVKRLSYRREETTTTRHTELTLRRLGVSYPMCMKSVGSRVKVLQVNINVISNFSFDDRA